MFKGKFRKAILLFLIGILSISTFLPPHVKHVAAEASIDESLQAILDKYTLKSENASLEGQEQNANTDQQNSKEVSPQFKGAIQGDLIQAKLYKAIDTNSASVGKQGAVSEALGTDSLVDQVDIENLETSSYPAIQSIVSLLDKDGKALDTIDPKSISVMEENITTGSGMRAVDPKKLSIEKIGSSQTKADIVFVVDTTGSMNAQISSVRSNITQFTNLLLEKKVNFRLAGYSYGDEVPYRNFYNFTKESKTDAEAKDASSKFNQWVNGLSAYGGDDIPENPLDSIISASKLDFRPDAQKIVMLITDAPAHIAGDGGDSATTATISSTYQALKGVNFFFTAPTYAEEQFNVLGKTLGTTFNANALLSTFFKEISSRYIIKYTSPFAKDDSLRKLMVRVKDPASGRNVSGTKNYLLGDKGELSGKVQVYGDGGSNSVYSASKANVIVRNKEGMVVGTATVGTDGTYQIKNLPVGTYTVEALIPAVTNVQTAAATIKNKTITKLNFTLHQVNPKQAKLDLIKHIKKYSSAYNGPEDEVIKWLNTIDEKKMKQSEVEAILRLCWAEQVLALSLPQADTSSQIFAEALGNMVGGALGIVGKIDMLKKVLKGQGFSEAELDALTEIRDAIAGLLVNIVSFVETGAKQYGNLEDNEAFSESMTYIKTFIKAQLGSLEPGDIANNLSKNIANNQMKKHYVKKTTPLINSTLGTAKSVASSGMVNVSGYNKDISAIGSSISVMFQKTNEIVSAKESLEPLLKALEIIKTINEAVGNLATLIGYIPGTQAVTVPVIAFTKALNTFIETMQFTINGFNGFNGFERFASLPDEVSVGMNQAFATNSGKTSLSTLTSMSRLAIAEAGPNYQYKSFAAALVTTDSELDQAFTQYLAQIDVLASKAPDLAAITAYNKQKDLFKKLVDRKVAELTELGIKDTDTLGAITGNMAQINLLLSTDHVGIANFLFLHSMLNRYKTAKGMAAEITNNHTKLANLLTEHRARVLDLKNYIEKASSATAGLPKPNLAQLEEVSTKVLNDKTQAFYSTNTLAAGNTILEIRANVFNISDVKKTVKLSLSGNTDKFTDKTARVQSITIDGQKTGTAVWKLAYKGAYSGQTLQLNVSDERGNQKLVFVEAKDTIVPTVSFKSSTDVMYTKDKMLIRGSVNERFLLKEVDMDKKKIPESKLKFSSSYTNNQFVITVPRSKKNSLIYVKIMDLNRNVRTISFTSKGMEKDTKTELALYSKSIVVDGNKFWRYLGDYKNVPVNKSWTIKVNQVIGQKSVTGAAVMKDSLGKMVPVKTTIASDKRSFKVTPLKPLPKGKKYSLYIQNNFKSRVAKVVKEPTKITFTTSLR